MKKNDQIHFKCLNCRKGMSADYVEGVDDWIEEVCPKCGLTMAGAPQKWQHFRPDSVNLQIPANIVKHFTITYR